MRTGWGYKVQGALGRVREKLPDASSGSDRVREDPDAGKVGQVRDLGDVIEVPIVEEELVKRPVVKEVLRIRKSAVIDRQSVSGDVRKEDAEIKEDSDTKE